MIELHPNLLVYVLEYLTINDISSYGSICLKVKHSDEFWFHLMSKRCNKQLITGGGRSLRSLSAPRVSFFNTIRLSRARLHQRLYLETRNLLTKVDSPVQLKKIFSDMNNKIFSDLYYNLCIGELMLYAAYMNRWKSVKVFIETLNTDKNYQAVDGNATVLIIASWRGNNTFVKWLLALSDKGNAPLNLTVKGKLMYSSACGGKGTFIHINLTFSLFLYYYIS